MSKTYLTYNELVVPVATISFQVENFVSYEKVLKMMLHFKRSFLLLNFSKFFTTSQKKVTKILKNARKGVHYVQGIPLRLLPK